MTCPTFKSTPTDYQVWRAALAKEGCVNEKLINMTIARIVEWPYKNPPRVNNFIEWYGQTALGAANVAPLTDVQDEIFECVMQHKHVHELTKGAYWIWRHANRIAGKPLKASKPDEIEKQVKRFYEKLTKTLIKAGPQILIEPVKALENHNASEIALKAHKEGNKPRPKNWKVTKEYHSGINQLSKIKELLK